MGRKKIWRIMASAGSGVLMKFQYLIIVILLFSCTSIVVENDNEIIVGVSPKSENALSSREKALNDAEIQILKKIGVYAEVSAQITTREVIEQDSEEFRFDSNINTIIDYSGYLKYDIIEISTKKISNNEFVSVAKVSFSLADYQAFKNNVITELINYHPHQINEFISFFDRYEKFSDLNKNTPGVKADSKLSENLYYKYDTILSEYKTLMSDVKISMKPYSIFDKKIFISVNKPNLPDYPIYVNNKKVLGTFPNLYFQPEYSEKKYTDIEIIMGYKSIKSLENIQPKLLEKLASPQHNSNINIAIIRSENCAKIGIEIENILKYMGYNITKKNADISITITPNIIDSKKILFSEYKVSSELKFEFMIDNEILSELNLPNNQVENLFGYSTNLETAKLNSINMTENQYQPEFILNLAKKIKKMIEKKME